MRIQPDMINVVVISPFAHKPGHFLPFACGLILALDKVGCDTALITTFECSGLEDEPDSVRSHYYRALILAEWIADILPFSMQRLLFSFVCLARAWFVGRRSALPVYHLLEGSLFLCALFARLTGKPVFLQCWTDIGAQFVVSSEMRGSRRLWTRFRTAFCLRAVREKRLLLITDSPIVAHINSQSGIDTQCIRYAIPAETAPIMSSPPASKQGGQRLVCLLFGTYRDDKDYETVFRAAHLCGGQVQIVIAGFNFTRTSFHEIAAKYPDVISRISEGFVSERDMPHWFNACDLVVLPYQSGRIDGSGLVYEALRFERPVVVTNGGFLADFIENYRTGLTYCDGDAADLAIAMRHFLALTAKEWDLWIQHLRSVVKEHSWSVRIEEYLKLYGNTCEGRISPEPAN